MSKELIELCDICQDLIPLVQDNVASSASQSLVLEHIQSCKSCQQAYGEVIKPEIHSTDDSRIIQAIKRRIYFSGLLIMILGALLGVYLTYSMGMFYNFIIMPLIGGIGYYLLGRKWYIAPILVFSISYLWLLIRFIIDYSRITTELFVFPLYLTIIYTGLTLLGVCIGALLKFAFKREDIK